MTIPAAPPHDAALPPSLAEFEETLKRLVDRITRILQADKCVFLLHDAATGTLYATPPALGFSDPELVLLERPVAEDGVSGEVFRTGIAAILFDAARDPRARRDGWTDLGIVNAVSVPLVVEKRGDDNRVLSRSTIGVLHVFNKKQGERFDDEDVRLLQRMAVQGAAVISKAQLYREAVQEKQELIHTIDSLYAGLLMVSLTGRVLQINPSARAILGIDAAAALIGLPFADVVPSGRVRSLLARALSQPGTEVADEISVPRLESSPVDDARDRVFQVQCAPVRGESDAPAGVVAIFNDITDIRGVERMKTAFISTVSHELRTPLTSIKGFISTLLDDTEGFYDEDTKREFYGIIDTECDRLTRLIKDLLDISRIEQGRAMQMIWADVDVPATAEKVVAAQRAYAKNHVLELSFPPDFPHIEADPDKLDQILTNLVSNAVKYSPHGGTVRVSGTAHGERVTLSVSDEGMGIAREHLPKIWERFYRVDNRDNREIGGTGIGLALVKALTEAHGGTVSVDSEVGRGTTFSLSLPVRQEKASE